MRLGDLTEVCIHCVNNKSCKGETNIKLQICHLGSIRTQKPQPQQWPRVWLLVKLTINDNPHLREQQTSVLCNTWDEWFPGVFLTNDQMFHWSSVAFHFLIISRTPQVWQSVVMLTGRALCTEESVIHQTVNPTTPRPVLCCALQRVQLGFQGVLCCTNSSAQGQTQPTHCNGVACRQLPLDTSDYTSCVALPVSKSMGKSSHVSILSVWQHKLLLELFPCEKSL